jgi:hypothetical protein
MNTSLYSLKFESLPDDIFLVSYPKSGNTWLRFLIGNYLTHNKCDFNNCGEIVPDMYHNPVPIELQRPRIIKSHSPFTSEYSRVIYIVRDGRDVAVSYYYYALKFGFIDSNTQFTDFLLQFNAGTLDDFTPWNHHINLWLDRAKQDFLLIKYEDLKANTIHELTRVLKFANLPIDSNRLISAVKSSEFGNMQKLEKHELVRAPGDIDPTIQFVRKGQIEEWRELFNEQLLADFIDCHGSALERLNYLSPGITEGVRLIKSQLQKAQAALQQSQILLEQSQAQQRHIQAELEQSQAQQRHIQAELEQSQAQQQHIQAELEQSQARQRHIQIAFRQFRVQTKARRQLLRTKLEQAQEQIAAMESSKFWKLRQRWLSLKQWVRKG